MKKTGFEPAPLVMAYILCPFLEEAFRQSLIKSHGDLSIFFKRPISATVLSLSFLFIILNIFTGLKKKRKLLIEKIQEESWDR
jgi:putative tricarboxylic transport membrane protein